MTAKSEIVTENGAVVFVPLNKLKKSPDNARKVPHSAAEIEARAASIAAKGVLQPLVVAPEFEPDGLPTGYYLVTIGEGRRQAQLLRAKRKEIRKSEPVRCIVDTSNDPHEISLDENVSRSDMHPADEFEAFKRLADEKGYGAEEIAARFGVSAHVVRQRMRLGAVSPKLLAVYREGGLTLDHLMAFAVSDDHARQEQVFESFGDYPRAPSAIRRAMTEAKVHADDKRALFVGAEAYGEAGGTILRDLFTEDGGGWFEDVALLDRLASEKLEAIAVALREAEGWKWVEAHMDFPPAHGLRRVYPHRIERTSEEEAQITALAEEYDALTEKSAEVDELPPDVEARFNEIDAALDAYQSEGFHPEEIAIGGAFVVLGHDGMVRTERGFIRAEDDPPPEPEVADEANEDKPSEAETEISQGGEAEDDEPDGLAPLSDRLVADLTAHRTAGLQDALAENPDVALIAVLHAIVLRLFYYGREVATCLDVRAGAVNLSPHAPEIEDSPACRRINERHEAWARQMPQDPGGAWTFVVGLDGDSRVALLAHCAGLSVNAVRTWERRPGALAHADVLAQALSLDMTANWTATERSYFGRVTKARIGEAVAEAVGEDAAERIGGMKKQPMAQAAEQLVAGSGWLPPLLRAPEPPQEEEAPREDGVSAGPYSAAAE